MHVYFFEAFEEEEERLRSLIPNHWTAHFHPLTIQELNFDNLYSGVLCVRTQSKISEQLFTNCRAIFTRSQGYDHLQNIKRVHGDDKPMGYLKNYSSRSVAEQAILSMLALSKKLLRQTKQFRTFNRNGLTGEECFDKRVLVVGVGAIGCEIVHLCRGLGMNVKGADPVHRLDDLQYVNLDDGLRWADYIFCALPLKEDTENLIRYSSLKSCQRKPFVINISRAEITPVLDMKQLLQEQRVRGLALDVYPDEAVFAEQLRSSTTPLDSPFKEIVELKHREDVLFTPHNAFNTRQALEQKCLQTVEALVCYESSGQFPYQI